MATQQPIAIAGATGFVGRSLIGLLGPQRAVIGLSRTRKRAVAGHENVQWRTCSFVQQEEAEKALQGAGVAVYLLHSMSPQGAGAHYKFEDMDLLCADNFARAAQACGVKHIIYLTGLLPDETNLSPHLASRLEVEQTFKSTDIPLTIVRAGIVLGPGGSSFELLSKMVARLPVMVAPRWTQSKTQAVALRDVTAALAFAIRHPKKSLGTWDVGCPEVLSYQQMMKATAKSMGKKRRLIKMPFNVPDVSLRGLSLITGSPIELLLPLAQSLKHDMIADPRLRLQRAAGITPTSFAEALRIAVEEEPEPKVARRAATKRDLKNTPDLHIKRLAVPTDDEALWNGDDLRAWLQKFVVPMVRVTDEGGGALMLRVAGAGMRLVRLQVVPEESSQFCKLLSIRPQGWWQGARPGKAFLEFRRSLTRKTVLLVARDASAGAGKFSGTLRASRLALTTRLFQGA